VSSVNDLVRFFRLGLRQRLLLAEAFAAVTIFSLAIRLLPFRRAVQLGSRKLGAEPGSTPAFQGHDHRWALDAVGARVPWKAQCFQKGLALQWMLRRVGQDARLHYGVGRDAADRLQAHVWISQGNEIVFGREEADRFEQVAVYPSC